MSTNKMSGVILEGTRIEGKLTFNEKLRIDGEFKGEIHSRGQLVVGKTAKVEGDLDIGECIVLGEVNGKISNCEFLQIEEGGKLLADINVKKLEIKPGAVFDGQCKMSEGKEVGQNQSHNTKKNSK